MIFMKINNNNQQNFNGKLFVAPNISDEIIEAIKNNKQLKQVLSSPNDLYVGVKLRLASKNEIYKQGRDDVLTKIYFFIEKPAKSFMDKVRNFFAKKYYLTSRYHSNHTNLQMINNEEHIAKIVAKMLKK